MGSTSATVEALTAEVRPRAVAAITEAVCGANWPAGGRDWPRRKEPR
jgi:hypothetical protein